MTGFGERGISCARRLGEGGAIQLREAEWGMLLEDIVWDRRLIHVQCRRFTD